MDGLGESMRAEAEAGERAEARAEGQSTYEKCGRSDAGVDSCSILGLCLGACGSSVKCRSYVRIPINSLCGG